MTTIPIIFRLGISMLSVFLFSYSTLSFGTENTILLVCKYADTLDLSDGKKSKTSGEMGVVITYTDVGTALIRTSGEKSAVYVGFISEYEIYGESDRKIEISDKTIEIHENLRINRLTGKFSESFSPGGTAGLIHSGECSTTKERKF